MSHDPKIIVALDFSDERAVMEFVSRVNPEQCRLKVGKELFTTAGPELVRQLVDLGFDVFLDLKYHDIPNTVAKACSAAARLGVWMVNVHASGGRRMMEAAREAIDASDHKPLLIGVTVLTSMATEDLNQIGVEGEPEDQVIKLAKLAKDSGLDGVVCSAKEVTPLRAHLDADFHLVTPGIRPRGTDQGDQRRVVTPSDALEMGASYLVIGRPITQSPDPMATLQAINEEIAPHTN